MFYKRLSVYIAHPYYLGGYLIFHPLFCCRICALTHPQGCFLSSLGTVLLF